MSCYLSVNRAHAWSVALFILEIKQQAGWSSQLHFGLNN